MADDVTISPTIESTPSSISGLHERKMINVNVDYSGDQWLVVSYETEKGDTFQGILLKANETNGTDSKAKCDLSTASMSFRDPELWRKSKSQQMTWPSSPDTPQSILLNGSRSSTFTGLDPHKVLSVALRRTFSNGASKPDGDFGLLNTKPALGIRRLENRSFRLRPMTNQRNIALCARCQEQRVCTPASSGRRNATNGNPVDRRNAPTLLCSTSPVSIATTPTSTFKRRSTDTDVPIPPAPNSQNISIKKLKSRNCTTTTTTGVDSDQPSSSASTSSKINTPSVDDDISRTVNTGSSSTPIEGKLVNYKIPKLKISFGNKESKTTTIIAMPPSQMESVKSCPNINDVGLEKEDSVIENSDRSIDIPSNGAGNSAESDHLLPRGLRIGDIVWAKMPSSPYWPSRIFSINGNAVCVTWCGSKQYGFVDAKALEPFKEMFRKRYNAKRNSGNYQKAVAEAIVKCSGTDGDSTGSSNGDSFYYKHLISSSCWKYLTGSKHSTSKSRSSERKRPHRSGKRNRKDANTSHGSTDSERTPSVSSMNSPSSTSATPSNMVWQPKLVIRNANVEMAANVQDTQHGRLEFKPMHQPRLDDRNRPVQMTPVSPLPVERSREDDEEEEDEADGFRLQIDETVHLDDGDNDDASPCSSSVSASISPAIGGAFRLITTTTTEKIMKNQLLAGNVGVHMEKAQGNHTRTTGLGVGENQDDFESALSELQEMEEMCAGTSSSSVLTRC